MLNLGELGHSRYFTRTSASYSCLRTFLLHNKMIQYPAIARSVIEQILSISVVSLTTKNQLVVVWKHYKWSRLSLAV